MCRCSGLLRYRRAKKNKKTIAILDREASLIKKEYCSCGPHPLQLTSSRARPPLVKGAGHIGLLFPEFQGWPLWFMVSIALQRPHQLAPEVVPGASLHSEALTPECGRECLEIGDCGPARHVRSRAMGTIGTDCSGVARVMTPRPPPQPHGWVRMGLEVIEIPAFLEWGQGSAQVHQGVSGLFSSIFSPHP